MNIRQVDLSAGPGRCEMTITYGNGQQQINIVANHPDMSTAAAMAALQVVKKIKGICETEAFDAGQKEQDKQFDSFLEPLPTMIEKNGD